MSSTVAIVTVLTALSLGASEKKAAPKKTGKETPAVQQQAVTPPPVVEQKKAPKQARIIELDEKVARVFHTVTAHPSVPAIIEFPEPLEGTPSCGDCVSGNSPPEVLQSTQALFLIDVFPQDQYISMKPIQFPVSEGGAIPDDAFLTTVTVRLKSKLTITLRVQFAKVDDADARVVFTLPGRSSESAFVRDQVEGQRKELEATFAARVEEATVQEFLRAIAEPHECLSKDARARHDNVVVEVKEMCRFGRAVYFRVEVENRGRALVQLGELAIKRNLSGSMVPVESPVTYAPMREVAFQKKATAVVGFRLEEGEEPAAAYELVLTEDGGKGRAVSIANLSF